jgi:hypothetical protein
MTHVSSAAPDAASLSTAPIAAPDAGAPRAVVVGAGPAGLMAADVMAQAGLAVTLIDQAPTFGRKFLMAGRGGLNLTHSEPLEAFLARYGAREERLAPIICAFPPQALIAFAASLGQPTFVGSSGRVFPRAMKASPMLRVWLTRLGRLGVQARTRTRFLDFADGGVRVVGPEGEEVLPADVVTLAMGGASWPKLGSDARWAPALERAGAPLRPFAPSNCGLLVDWSAPMRARAGEPLKRVALSFEGREALGDAMVTTRGLEGGPVYALSPALREALSHGSARLSIDLRPDLDVDALAQRLAIRRKGDSLANVLRKAAGLSAAAAALARETGPLPSEPEAMARAIKSVALPIAGVAGLERAISSAGGVDFAALDEDLALRARPNVFLAGEMLDWEAPTGGYLLQACFSMGFVAGRAAARRALARA